MCIHSLQRAIVWLGGLAVLSTVSWLIASSNTGQATSTLPPPPFGPIVNEPGAYKGYTLIAPMKSTQVWLIDMDGRIVHTWNCDTTPGLETQLLDNGHLLRTGILSPRDLPFEAPGAGGRVEEFTWDGERVWDFKYFNDKQLPHHDVTKLPNGNILMIVWDRKTAAQAIAAGRKPDSVRDGHLMADAILEIKPTDKTTGEVVWEWHVWDHLIQEQDKTRANHGTVTAHPELIDLNFGDGILPPLLANKDNADKLRGIGYLGGPAAPGQPRGPVSVDWTHINAVAYNAQLDEIVLSAHGFNEIWIIDHSTTKAEAAGHSGGRRGKGGDLLYRWGNPKAYRSGTTSDQRLFGQHNAHWIAKGLPGEGHLLVFNNGTQRPDGTWSSVDEIVPPVDAEGRYTRKPGLPFGPERAQWSFKTPKKTNFYSVLIAGAHRLPNGNTFICSGVSGTLYEVTPEKDIVWKYITPPLGKPGRTCDPGVPMAPIVFGTSLFRSYRYGTNHPGLVGKDLKPGRLLGEPE
jgi:hypothetical protein